MSINDSFIAYFLFVLLILVFIAFNSGTLWNKFKYSKLKDLIFYLNQWDILKIISNFYLNINIIYRKSFWIIFGFLCFAFGFHTICFMWGNHDWWLVEGTTLPWEGRAFEGRYAVYLFKKIFLNNTYLPLLYDFITFVILSLNAILLCIYWKLKKKVIYFVLCGLILTMQPFTLAMLFYIHMGPEVFMGITFVILALIISEKIISEKNSLITKIILSLLSITLINLSLAMYPVLINTIAVVLVGRIFIQSLDWNGSKEQFKICFRPYLVSITNIVLGILSYKIMVSYAIETNLDRYNTQILPLNELQERLLVLLKQSFNHLYDYGYPFISQGALWVFSAFFFLLFIYSCSKGTPRQKACRLFLLLSSLFTTQVAMLIANYYMEDPRIELFGLVFFQTLIAVCVFTQFKDLRNISVIIFSSIVFMFLINDLDCLRVWKLGFDAEKMLWNRITMRLENNPEFNVKKKYNILFVGKTTDDSMRIKFYNNEKTSVPSDELLYFSYNLSKLESLAFYYPVNFISQYFSPEMQDKKAYYEQLKRLYDAGILDKAKAWPDENGLIVWDDIILYVTDEKILEDYKKQLQEEYGVKNAD